MREYSNKIEERLTARHKYSFLFCGDVKGKDVLDVGSSFGWFEKMALEAGCKKIVGIEPDEKLFYEAKKEVPMAVFKKGSALKIPVNNKSFDLVVMFDVLEHLPRGTETIAFREVKRVLKPGGTFVMSTPLDYWLSKVLDPAWYFGHRHYKEIKLVKMLEKTGFKIKKIEKRGRIFELVSALLMYIFKWFLRREIPFKEWFEMKKNREYFTQVEGFETLFIKLVN